MSSSVSSFRVVSILAIVSLSLSVISCDSIVTKKPESSISVDNFFETKKDAISAVNSVYDELGTMWLTYPRGLYLLAELPTDNAERGQGVNNRNIVNIGNFSHTITNDRVLLLWQNFYEAINNANLVLDRVPEMEISNSDLKNRILAEARFGRALSYFNLVRFFGGVPLHQKFTQSISEVNKPRASVDEVYNLIIEDLQFAKENLRAPPQTETGRATNTAASGLLAKVYLTREQWELALEETNFVIDSGHHGLMENFRDVFLPATEGNKEIIFTIQHKANVEGYEQRLMLPRGEIPNVTGWAADVPRPEFYEFFSDEDTRKGATFWTVASSEQTGQETVELSRPHWFKFIDLGSLQNPSNARTDTPVLRYSDVLLMFAEASNEVNGGPTSEAYQMINRVRNRAFGGSDHELSGLSQQQFREAVWKERRLEFAAEAERWFDLKRTDRLVEVNREAGYENVQEFHRRYPIPQKEMTANPLIEQNPGY